MMEVLLEDLQGTLKITFIVIGLMTIIDFLELRYERGIKRLLTEKPLSQYVVSSLLGAIPGCVDAFLIDSLYIHGLVGFGALVSVMLSTVGDEAFIMLTMIPEAALWIFGICVIVGMIGGFLSDKVAERIGLERSPPCEPEVKRIGLSPKEFFRHHFYDHILKEHVPKLFLWLFLTMVGIHLLMQNFNLAEVLPQNRLLLLMTAALIAIIPESGPHLIFLMLYKEGVIPFSVLLVNSIGQDGHGLLPLLSYSVRDTFNVQVATTAISIIVAVILFFTGV